jgi:hypothetical protein
MYVPIAPVIDDHWSSLSELDWSSMMKMSSGPSSARMTSVAHAGESIGSPGLASRGPSEVGPQATAKPTRLTLKRNFMTECRRFGRSVGGRLARGNTNPVPGRTARSTSPRSALRLQLLCASVRVSRLRHRHARSRARSVGEVRAAETMPAKRFGYTMHVTPSSCRANLGFFLFCVQARQYPGPDGGYSWRSLAWRW